MLCQVLTTPPTTYYRRLSMATWTTGQPIAHSPVTDLSYIRKPGYSYSKSYWRWHSGNGTDSRLWLVPISPLFLPSVRRITLTPLRLIPSFNPHLHPHPHPHLRICILHLPHPISHHPTNPHNATRKTQNAVPAIDSETHLS